MQLPLCAPAVCLLFLPVLAHAADNAAPDKSGTAGWAQVPEILKRIVPPHFPDHDFLVTKYGAIGDGTTDCTDAFQTAIAACHAAGGGRVVVPAGKYLTGAIHLLSNVNLSVSKDATILFSTDPKKYLPVVFTRDTAVVMNYSPLIYALDQENIAVTGEGTLDGQASKGVWPSWVKKYKEDGEKVSEMGEQKVPVSQRIMGEGHYIRPNFVEPVRCKNVLIQGVHVIDSPRWVLNPLLCTNVTVSGVTVFSHGKNNDGCDPDSCTDVLIKNCSFSDGDDCIAVKAGRGHDDVCPSVPSQNIVIQGCKFEDGHGGVTLGSETAGGLRNVFAENCEFDSANLDQAMRFKTNPARGGFIENIYIRNCQVKTAKFGIYMTMHYASDGASTGNLIPVVRDIDIRDCTFEMLSRQAIYIEGWSPTAQITDVTIANCQFPPNKRENIITNAARINISNAAR